MKMLVICLLVIAARLAGQPPSVAAISFEIQSARLSTETRRGTRLVEIFLTPVGIPASRVEAARALITRARDDAGGELTQPGPPEFFYTGVGSVAGDNSRVTSRQPLSFRLTPLNKDAKVLPLVEGTVELFVPDLDPDATVAVDDICTRFGSLIQSPGLERLGVTLIVFDKQSRDKFKTADGSYVGGPQLYDAGPQYGSRLMIPESVRARFVKGLENDQDDYTVGVVDPQHRVLTVEFQGVGGAPLAYNHNGNYHSNGSVAEGKRCDVYRVEHLPRNARFVCWLITAKSVITVPLELTNVALPPR